MSEEALVEVDFCGICKEADPCDFKTRCGHLFHELCLESWFISNSTCPYCRQNISKSKSRELLLWNIKRPTTEKTVVDEIEKFFNSIIIQDINKYPIPKYGREMVKNLTQMGWNINIKDDGGFNLLRNVCIQDDLYRLNLLFEHGLVLSDETEKQVLEIAKVNQSNLVYSRIRNRKINSNYDTMNESTQLHEACSKNDLTAVKDLIENGADVNARDKRGTRPLHKACASASLELIEYLIEKGAEINCVDINGKSPIYEACISSNENINVVKKLLELDANLGYLDQDKNTLLHTALISRKFNIASVLVDSYETVTTANCFGETPLHLAASDYGSLELIQKLVEKGAEINSIDSNGRTPLHRATIFNEDRIVKCLLKKGANVNKLDNNGESAVLLALKRVPSLPFVKVLIQHGADLNFKNSKGKTALEISLESHY
jgi:ankyrin repeat protein